MRVCQSSAVFMLVGLLLVSISEAQEITNDLDAPVLQDVVLRDRDPEKPIAIMVMDRKDATVPAQTLLLLEEDGDVEFRVEEGPAHFLYRSQASGELEPLKQVTYRASMVRLPILVPVHPDYDSQISIKVNGETIADPIRVFTNTEDVYQAVLLMPSFRRAMLRLGHNNEYALINEAAVIFEDSVEDYLGSEEVQDLMFKTPSSEGAREFSLEPPEDLSRRPLDGVNPRFIWCPWEEIPPGPGDFTSDNECPNWLLPTGYVEWRFTNPMLHGYSYKPESSSTLQWASGDFNIVDGVYRTSWGCGSAIKVPDNVKLIALSPALSTCCQGFFARALVKRCSRVSPGAIGWPLCPLI